MLRRSVWIYANLHGHLGLSCVYTFSPLEGCQAMGVSFGEISPATVLAFGVVGIVARPSRLSLPEFCARFDDATFPTLFVGFVSEPFEVGLAMNAVVRENFQVLDGIIEGIAVLVMDDLLWQEGPAEMLLDDEAVFHPSTTTTEGPDPITISVDGSALVTGTLGAPHEGFLAPGRAEHSIRRLPAASFAGFWFHSDDYTQTRHC